MYKLGFGEAEESEFKFPTFVGSSKKQESSRKISTSTLLTIPKPLIVWTTTYSGKNLLFSNYSIKNKNYYWRMKLLTQSYSHSLKSTILLILKILYRYS